jgi:hypothetical protein
LKVEVQNQKINFLLNHPTRLSEIGNMAKEFVSQHFHIQEVTEQYLEFFKIIKE